MSTQEKIYEYDTNEMFQEMQFVMKKGLSKILIEFMDRYELLEKTHKQIMKLPSVLNELNRETIDNTISEISEKVIYKNVEKWLIVKDYIEKYQNEVDWINISAYQKLSEEFIRRFKDKINFKWLKENENISEEIRNIDYFFVYNVNDKPTYKFLDI